MKNWHVVQCLIAVLRERVLHILVQLLAEKLSAELFKKRNYTLQQENGKGN